MVIEVPQASEKNMRGIEGAWGCNVLAVVYTVQYFWLSIQTSSGTRRRSTLFGLTPSTMDSLNDDQRYALSQLRELTNGGDDEAAIIVLESVGWDVQVGLKKPYVD